MPKYHVTISSMKRLILASQSPTRAHLLRQIGYDFEVIPSDYEEDMTLDLPPADLIKLLARGKAEVVASAQNNAVVLGADSFIVFKGQYIGKPLTKERAVEVLTMLSGQTHEAWTGFALVDTVTGKTTSEARSCRITFRHLSDDEIMRYVETEEPLEKAGSYTAMLKGAAFIERYDGDYYAVLGLPISSVVVALREFGIPLPW